MALPALLLGAAFRAVIWPAIQWILRAIIIKFVVITCLMLLMTELMPYVIQHLTPFTNGQSLSSAFNNLTPHTAYFVRIFRLDFGLPLIISAYVARFLIRRIPVIG